MVEASSLQSYCACQGLCHTSWRLDELLAVNEPLSKVYVLLDDFRDVNRQVVNAVRYQRNNGWLEGFNNLIARILHRGCGYRDADYLKLELRQAALPAELQVPVFQKQRRAKKKA